MQLDGKRVIVTGGARGIGAATVRAFVAEGATVASLDLRDELGAQVARDADDKGPGTARYLHCDIADRTQVDATFSDVVRDFGGLDVLANIAGIGGGAAAADVTDEEWDRVFAVNVKGTLYTNQAAYRAMRGAGGRIINVASDAGLQASPYRGHYSASKGAVMSWTRTIAAEWGPEGITANALVPAMWTPLYEASRARMTPEALAQHDARMAAQIPIGGRLGDPDVDLAPVMVFLAGDGSRFVTGQLISVNGGLNSVR
ncbi:MAG TPA: SDR family NAD(P)-dependent oxidoreductase [Acidimicrobiia bacterium]|nr:SDR family NAD(P)-dependent oxidoreductase [Acidimicrobiia bacterium]